MHVTGLTTTVTRNRLPFATAVDALSKVELARAVALDLLDEHDVDDIEAVVRKAQAAIDPDDLDWNTERVAGCQEAIIRLQSVIEQINQIDVRSAKLTKIRRSAEKAIPRLQVAAEAGELADPAGSMRSLLAMKVPKFVLFSDDDRDLAEAYNPSDEAARSQPPAPLRNLLTVAGTTARGSVERHSQWRSCHDADAGTPHERDTEFTLQPMWTQSKLTIELALNQGGILEVNIHELDSPNLHSHSDRRAK